MCEQTFAKKLQKKEAQRAIPSTANKMSLNYQSTFLKTPVLLLTLAVDYYRQVLVFIIFLPRSLPSGCHCNELALHPGENSSFLNSFVVHRLIHGVWGTYNTLPLQQKCKKKVSKSVLLE